MTVGRRGSWAKSALQQRPLLDGSLRLVEGPEGTSVACMTNGVAASEVSVN
jgi:hypothetical protein